MAFSIQKANFWKRFSAWLVDTVLVLLLALTLSLPCLEILGFYENNDKLESVLQPYITQFEEEYGVDFSIDEESYNALPENEKKRYDEADAALNAALGADEYYNELNVNRISLLLTDAGITVFLAILLAHFVLPLILKNGQTLGKKTFGIAVIRTNGVQISPLALFIRSTVGLFAIETMSVAFLLMVYPVGTIAAVLVQALQIGVMIKTPHNASIHDLLADTAVVDFSSQQIFSSQEELNEYLKAEQAKKAQEAAY